MYSHHRICWLLVVFLASFQTASGMFLALLAPPGLAIYPLDAPLGPPRIAQSPCMLDGSLQEQVFHELHDVQLDPVRGFAPGTIEWRVDDSCAYACNPGLSTFQYVPAHTL